MKTCYGVELGEYSLAIADLVAPGELTPGWTITRINVPRARRGEGHGTTLLKQILTDADAEGVELWLEPSPSDGLNYEQLVTWYAHYGFKMTTLGYMRREPGATSWTELRTAWKS